MKKTIFSVFAVLAVSIMANAQILTEHFNYTSGSALTANGWIAHSAAGTNPISVGATSLTFPQYSPVGLGGSAVSAGNGEDINTYFNPVTSGSVYASFLLKVDTIGGAGYFFHFMDSAQTSAYRARTFFQVDATNPNAYNLGLTFNNSTGVFDTTEFAMGSTILVVAKYTIVSGIDNDLVSLYAFKLSGGSFITEPATPLLGPVAGTAVDINPARIALRQFNTGNDFTVDAFRVNTVWSMSPPAPLSQIDLPITWDNAANVNYTVTDFGGNASAVVVDPMNASNLVLMSTKTSGAQNWAGTTLSTPAGLATAIPFAVGSTKISAVIMSPNAGITVRMKVENHTNSGIYVEVDMTTTVANQWDTLVFDFTNNASTPINFANTYDMVSIFYDFLTAPATPAKSYYLDNVFFGGGNSGTLAQIDLPITWDDAANINYTVTDFGGDSSLVVPSPTNASNTVLKTIKKAGAQTWAGTTLSTPIGLATAIPFSAGNTIIKVAVWSPDAGTVVRLKAENHTNGGISVETDATTTVAAAWDTLSFNFANQAVGSPINFANTYDMLSIFYGFGTAGGTTAKTYYCDNVWFAGVIIPPPPVGVSPYCNTQSFHFNNPAEVASSVFLTIKNVSSSSMEVIVESATAIAVDDLIIAGPAGGGVISPIDTPATGQLRRTISWAGATPPTVDFNVLWSKVAFGGNWQLLPSGSLAIPFGVTCPIVTPVKAVINLPITWNDTANVNYTVTDFGGNASSVVVDPMNASNLVLMSTKTSGAQNWAGTTLSTPAGLATAIPFAAGSTKISAVIMSPNAGITVRMKVEDHTNSAIFVEADMTTTVANQWDTLVFDFTNNATTPINFANTYDMVSIFYDFLTAPATPAKSYYLDNVFFGGGIVLPVKAQISLPITWNDTANVNYTVTDFGGNASSLVVDPTNASNMVMQSDKTAGAQTWAGTTLSTPNGLASAIPFSAGSTIITIMVWSPDAGVPVRLKTEDHTNGGISVETEDTTTMAGAWEMLTFDFSNQVVGNPINFANTYDMLSIFYNFGTDGATAGAKTYYCDNIMFGVALNQIDLPITFDDASVDYDLVSFGDAIDSIVVDPTDPTNMVLRQDKPVGAQTWAGTVVGDGGLANVIPFTATHHFITARVWSAAAGTPVLMKVENVATGSISVETIATTTVAGTWETLTFDFSANQPGTPAIDYTQAYGKVVVFGDFGNAASGKTFYFDDIEFSTSGIGVEEALWVNNFSVLPNPNNGTFTISGDLIGLSMVEIIVSDIQGRIIYRSAERTTVLNEEINLAGAHSGLYFIRILSANGSITEKIMIAQ